MNKEIKNVENNLEGELKELEALYTKNRGIILQLVQEGKLPQPRKLTRAERKALDAAKVNLFKVEVKDPRAVLAVKEDLADWIMDKVYPDFDFGAVDNDVCLWFGDYIFGLSYNNDLTVKN